MIKKRKLPKTVEVGGKTIHIQIIVDDIDDSWGYFDEDENTIVINEKALEKGIEFDVLAHEMIHAALRYSGIYYHSLQGNMEVEEAVVRCIENLFIPAYNKIK